MGSYYKEVRLASQAIDDVMVKRKNFNIHGLILEITRKFDVGKKVVLDRIETHKKFNKEIIVTTEEVIFT